MGGVWERSCHVLVLLPFLAGSGCAAGRSKSHGRLVEGESRPTTHMEEMDYYLGCGSCDAIDHP